MAIAGGRGRAFLIIGAIVAVVIAALVSIVRVHPAQAPLGLGTLVAPAPPPPPPPPWTTAQVRDLLAAVRDADREGLRAADYRVDALQDTVDSRDTGPQVDALADKAAADLAHDFAAGRIRNRHRFNWYIDDAGPDAAVRTRAILDTRRQGRLGAWLNSLLPDSAAYRALRDALADASDDEPAQRDRIKANMERWRWLPRGFGGGDRLYVNLPTYRLVVQRDGETAAGYRAVIGALDMPTPVLSAEVRQVIVNPDWIVPMSIVRKSKIKPSANYVFSRRADGTLRVRRKPGAGNALGKVKIEFPNKLAIYFHDTPSRSLFGASARTFSHGCVRVQDIDALARSLVANETRYDAALAGAATRSFPIKAWRADIVYLTLVPGEDGGLAFVGDPYGMDMPLAAALEGRKPATPAPAPLPPPRPGADALAPEMPATLPMPVSPKLDYAPVVPPPADEGPEG